MSTADFLLTHTRSLSISVMVNPIIPTGEADMTPTELMLVFPIAKPVSLKPIPLESARNSALIDSIHTR